MNDKLILHGIRFYKVCLSRGHRILDVGHGTGNVMGELLSKGYNVYGFDFYPEKTEEKNVKGKIVAADAARIPFSDRSFDIVYCKEVLEHMPDYAKCIEEITRVMKPSGALIISVPTRRTEKLFKFLNPSWLKMCGHNNIFSYKQLLEIFAKHNYRLLCSEYTNFFYSYFWLAHCFFKTSVNENGRPLRNEGLTKILVKIWEKLGKIPCLIRIIERAGNMFFPKSIVMYFRLDKN